MDLWWPLLGPPSFVTILQQVITFILGRVNDVIVEEI